MEKLAAQMYGEYRFQRSVYVHRLYSRREPKLTQAITLTNTVQPMVRDQLLIKLERVGRGEGVGGENLFDAKNCPDPNLITFMFFRYQLQSFQDPPCQT